MEAFRYPCKCLSCQGINPGFMPVGKEMPAPRPDKDMTVCGRCGVISMFDKDFNLRPATEQEQDEFYAVDRMGYVALMMASLKIKKGGKVIWIIPKNS